MVTNAEAPRPALSEHHQAGAVWLDADQGYRRILAVDPNEPQAIHLSGVIAYQRGELEVAVEYISRAIGLNGSESVYHSNLGNVFAAQGKLDEAVACYRHALSLNPNSGDARYNLANALKRQAKLDEAIACYRRALELQPDFAAGHINLGNTLRIQGLLDEATICFQRALELAPDLADSHLNLGNVLQDQGNLDDVDHLPDRNGNRIEYQARRKPLRPIWASLFEDKPNSTMPRTACVEGLQLSSQQCGGSVSPCGPRYNMINIEAG